MQPESRGSAHATGWICRAFPARRSTATRSPARDLTDVENHLARDFAADEPNTKWVTDITYVRRRWRSVAVSLRGRRSLLWPRCRLVDESLPKSAAGYSRPC